MPDRIFSSIMLASALVLITSGVSVSSEHAAFNQNPGHEAGYAQPTGRQHFDDAAGAMPFSDVPADQAVIEAEQSAEDISTSELLHAYDAVGADGPADTQASIVLKDTGPAECDLIDPLTVISGDYKEHVDRNVEMFSQRLGDRFRTWLARSGKYIGMMKAVFREKNLPEDLVYLALIESGFNPKAYSWAKASGPWQFISGTGKKYGLRIDSWVDERRDPEKATRAAAEYLKDLYEMFGTWSLAMAAYNAGEGRVSRAVQSNGTLDFWELRKTSSLAKETKEYVPRYLAARAIALSPSSYGLGEIEYEEPLSYDVVVLDGPIGLDAAARCCGTSTEKIKDLNPELKSWCTPPNAPGYRLKVPKGTAELFSKNYGDMPEKDRSGWGDYVVRRGDTLSKIAGRYGVSVSEIAGMNNIRRVSSISVGQRLLIPGASKAVYKGSGATASYASYDEPGDAPSTYRVRRGDTLGRIAARYRMSVSRLAAINGISTRSTIHPGQRLKLSGTATASYSSSTGSGSTGTYVVRKGDTLSSIAGRHGMSLTSLVSLNGLSRRSVIRPGQRLKVRTADRAESSGTYRVRSGDNLWSISRKLGVDVNVLMNANSLGEGSVLMPGTELSVPAKGGLET